MRQSTRRAELVGRGELENRLQTGRESKGRRVQRL